MPAFENLRVNPFQSDRSKTCAFVSCKINTEMGAIYLNNMTLVNGTNGLFLSFPSRKLPKPDNQGREYQNHFFMDRGLKEPLTQAAIAEYQNRVQQNQQGGGGGYGGQQGGGYGNQGGGQQGGGYGHQGQQETPYGNPPAEDDIPF